MVYTTAGENEIIKAKELWMSNFGNNTPDFCNFLFSAVSNDRIYIAVENNNVVAMLMAAAELEYKNKKGCYLYSACADNNAGGKEAVIDLVKYVIKDMESKGFDFCVTKPADKDWYKIYGEAGFDKTVQMRKANIEIKKNIWQSADFDIATASRFRPLRSKFSEENIVHYTSKDYEKYAMYLYTFGGSTAESENAFAVYYIENNKLVVKEIMAESTLHATKLLQTIRERTGFEEAEVQLSKDSNLFLGEGKLSDEYMTYGLAEDVYINLMFE